MMLLPVARFQNFTVFRGYVAFVAHNLRGVQSLRCDEQGAPAGILVLGASWTFT